MRLRRRRDPHARYRELLAQQMDVPLRLDESWQLSVHLARCQACQSVEREYRDQRKALRQLQVPPVPRDLWARTAVALDREMAASGRRGTVSRTGAGASIAASLAVFGAAALLVISQWPLADRPSPTDLLPTPFAVPGQALAFVSSGPAGLSIYRTSVDRVCPVSATDCINQPTQPSALHLSRHIEPSSLALSPSGRQLAISGRDRDRESVVAIVIIPDEVEGPRQTTAPLPSSPEPSADASPTPAESQPPSPAATATAAPGLAVVAILEDAIEAGAQPAWSADGSILAFSAQPSDGSRGPDLYAWRPGDELAHRLTADGATYFASWSGERIVVSRIVADPADGRPVALTVVIDPLTGEERTVADAALWLPQVNVTGTHAVAWHGSLSTRGRTVVADSGALYVLDWTALDPFAASEPSPSPPDSPPPAAAETPLATEPAVDETPADPPTSTQAPRPTVLFTLPPVDDDPTDSEPSLLPETPQPTATAEPSSSPAEMLGLVALEPGRDPALKPVQDWEVRWSPDGTLVGLWIADAPGASWGRLAVLSLDTLTGQLAIDQPLLGPTLARRSFSLNADRLAWVAPADHSPDGELRLTTWGPDGFGMLRVYGPENETEIAPF